MIAGVNIGAHGVVVSRLLRMQKALGSNPSGSIFALLEAQSFIFAVIMVALGATLAETAWPSGLRRQLKALVRKGVGSNPTAVIFEFVHLPLFRFPNGAVLSWRKTLCPSG